MKVVFVDQILRVNQKYSVSLVNALREKGHDVLVIGEALDSPFENLLSVFDTSNKKRGKITKALNYIFGTIEIYKSTMRSHAEVLHVQWFQLSPVDYLLLRLVKKRKIRVVVTVHDILPFNEHFFDKHFHRRIYELADCIIVQAESNISRINSIFPGLSAKVKYIPHGHFLDHSQPVDKKLARRSLDIPDRVVGIFFGQIKEVKGVDILIKAFAQYVREHGSDLFIIIAGNIWHASEEYYRSLLSKYSKELEGNALVDIRYIPDDEIPLYFSCADFSILPYRDVYQSGVLQLSYAYEKPVVASRIPAFEEIVSNNENGFLFEAGNVDQLKDCLLKCVSSYENLSDMGIMGREKVRDAYSWSTIAKSVSDLYGSAEILSE